MGDLNLQDASIRARRLVESFGSHAKEILESMTDKQMRRQIENCGAKTINEIRRMMNDAGWVWPLQDRLGASKYTDAETVRAHWENGMANALRVRGWICTPPDLKSVLEP